MFVAIPVLVVPLLVKGLVLEGPEKLEMRGTVFVIVDISVFDGRGMVRKLILEGFERLETGGTVFVTVVISAFVGRRLVKVAIEEDHEKLGTRGTAFVVLVVRDVNNIEGDCVMIAVYVIDPITVMDVIIDDDPVEGIYDGGY